MGLWGLGIEVDILILNTDNFELKVVQKLQLIHTTPKLLQPHNP
jgi:hypothetical protein